MATETPQEPVKATVLHRSGLVHGETYVRLADGLPEKVYFKGSAGALLEYWWCNELNAIHIGEVRFNRHVDGRWFRA